MNKFVQPQFLPFCPEILVIPTKAIINVHGRIDANGRQNKPFSFFFALRILSASLRGDILMITFSVQH